MFEYRSIGRPETLPPVVQFEEVLRVQGAGPFTLTGPTPQVIEYVGSEAGAVTVELPVFPAGAGWDTTGYLFVVINNGTGGGTVDVTSDGGTAPVQDGTGIAVGEARWYLWDGATPEYLCVATSGSGGGGSFVNPMANATYLQGEKTDTTPQNLVGVNSSDQAEIGSDQLPLRLKTNSAGGILQVAGTNRYTWSDSGFLPTNNNARTLGANGNFWLGLFNAGRLTAGLRQVSGNSPFSPSDTDFAVSLSTTMGVTVTLPNALTNGNRLLFIRNSPTSGANVTVSTTVVDFSGTLTPGQWVLVGANGVWYALAAG